MNNMEDPKAIVLFDGVCHFCNSSVNFIIKHDKKDYFRFTPLQSEKGKALLQLFNTEDFGMDSLVLIENNSIYRRTTAVLKIAKQLNGLYFLLYAFIIIPRFLRDGIYNLVAKNRYKWFGKYENCMVPTPEVKEKFIF
jgi:predicted DCC family thiol-disulfide oxidoreductase YuxK